MRRYEFIEKLADCKIKYVRVSKSEAKGRFCNGETITFIPCNCSPASPIYRLAIGMSLEYKDNDMITKNMSNEGYFTYLVNEYALYNCNNELGNYVAFYRSEVL